MIKVLFVCTGTKEEITYSMPLIKELYENDI